MGSMSAIQKRIRRHVIGRERDYFAATSPGLEKWCLEEIQSLGPGVVDPRITRGGVTFKGRFDACCTANLHLRTANRVLMRIDGFRAQNFADFSKKLVRIPWELFLAPGETPTVNVATRHCRLFHTGALEERVVESIPSSLKVGPHLLQRQRIFVRGVDDRFTVSLDSSGDNLYMRGIKNQGGAAPIRETLAAAILKAAGYRPGQILVDPMCGTGTFGLEAAMMCRNMPAGWFRRFAFEDWPAFSRRTWDYVRRECERRFDRVSAPVVFASDQDSDACDRLAATVRHRGLSPAVRVETRDFFSFSPAPLSRTSGLVVINPPYGRRLGSRHQSAGMMGRIGSHLQSAYAGWRFALILPPGMKRPRGLHPRKSIPLSHGGLKLNVVVGKIQ